MAQQSKLIHCQVRVVDDKCKVYEYEGDFFDTCHAATDAIDRFDDATPPFSVTVRALGTCLFSMPNLSQVA